MTRNKNRMLLIAVAVLLLVCLAISVPIWALQTNPPITGEPPWDGPQTRSLAQRACFDCHSNETLWPVYAKIPPVAWLVTFDTVRGRRSLNLSEWSSSSARRAREVGGQIRSGEMPPAIYTIMHPVARLSTAEQGQLITGFANSLR